MFFHGIHYKYLKYQFPILSPRLTILRQNNKQRADRRHLIEKFGFEPVHFLESSNDYPTTKCLEACFKFGNVVFVFQHLPFPFLQLSNNEVGVPVIDIRQADYIITQEKEIFEQLKNLFKNSYIILMRDVMKMYKMNWSKYKVNH